MKVLILALALGLAAAPKLAAAVEPKALELRPKAALAASAPHNSAQSYTLWLHWHRPVRGTVRRTPRRRSGKWFRLVDS